jgi:hypothetical protein
MRGSRAASDPYASIEYAQPIDMRVDSNRWRVGVLCAVATQQALRIETKTDL